MNKDNQSKFTRHEECPSCGSSNNLARYSDGHAVCFGMSCNYYEKGTGEVTDDFSPTKPTRRLEVTGVHADITDRRISQRTCKKYNVTVEYGPNGTISKHHYPYYDKDGQDQIGSKVRTVEGKQFYATGTMQGASLFGQQAWSEGGKYITITEGEADALAVAEMFDCKFPVVSLKTGASGAVKDIKENLDWLETFDNIVICFDNDEPGQKASKEVLDLFTPNKAKNVVLSMKDAGDMLKSGKIREFTQEWWNAKSYRPDGIVTSSDTWDLLIAQDNITSIEYPWKGLNDFTKGFRRRELVTITSGSGMGKSQMTRELTHYLLRNTEDRIGILALEEDIPKTTLGIMSVEANKPLHLDPNITHAEQRKYWEATMGDDRFVMLDHWGSTQEDNLLGRIRYMAKGLDCKWIILDHLSIVVSDQENPDERKAIDSIMTKLRSLVQETGVGLFLVSHLKRPQGTKGHEEGQQVSLADLRGSASIAQLSDMVIGLERNQQHEDPEIRNTTTVRVLKNRFVGLTGACCYLHYDGTTGRMKETSRPEITNEHLEF
jgi:twinkle protein